MRYARAVEFVIQRKSTERGATRRGVVNAATLLHATFFYSVVSDDARCQSVVKPAYRESSGTRAFCACAMRRRVTLTSRGERSREPARAVPDLLIVPGERDAFGNMATFLHCQPDSRTEDTRASRQPA